MLRGCSIVRLCGVEPWGTNPELLSWGIDILKKIAKNLGTDVEEGWEEVLKAAPAQDMSRPLRRVGLTFRHIPKMKGFSQKGGEMCALHHRSGVIHC